MFGNPEVTTGGRALKFYASVRLDVRRIEQIKVAGAGVGNRTRVKVVKNKVAPPFKEAEFDIMFGTGISREGEILDLGVKLNIIDKSGAWFSFEGERLGQGRDNVKELLKNDPALAEKIADLIRAAIAAPAAEPARAAAAPKAAQSTAAKAPAAEPAGKTSVIISADDFE